MSDSKNYAHAAVLVVLLAAMISTQATGQDSFAGGNVPFSEFAEAFVENLGFEGIERNDAALAIALEAGYVKACLGHFDVWYPRSFLIESGHLKSFQAISQALIDMQDVWLGWIADDETARSASGESKLLRKWIRSWKVTKSFKRRDPKDESSDLIHLLKAKDAVAKAAEGYAARMIGAEYLKGPRAKKESILLILSPTRKDFLGLGCFIGSLSEENRRLLWTDGLALWTSFSRESVHVVALEHPAAYPGRGDITQGLDMNAKEKTGLLQHVVQISTELIINRQLGESLPHDLANGLAMYMVIELFGENNVRAGGGSGGNQTASSSRFVRGGRSTGGKLAAVSAEPRWREEKGKGYFVEILRTAQKDGARDAFKSLGSGRDARAFFTLQSESVAFDFFVQAPFLGGKAPSESVPEEYSNDFLEFFRAYRCAFTCWLMTKAKSAKDRTSSGELLRRLLQALPASSGEDRGSSFEQTVEEIYGVSFSGKDGHARSLEWLFLEWLARSK